MAYGKIDSLNADAVTLQVMAPLKSSPPDSSCSCCFLDLLFSWVITMDPLHCSVTNFLSTMSMTLKCIALLQSQLEG